MKILIPMHVFSDSLPESEVYWEITHALARQGAEIYVITAYAKLQVTSKEELSEKNIHVYVLPLFAELTVGWMPLHRFLTWIVSLPLIWIKHIDWVFWLEGSQTPFARFKLKPLAMRTLLPLDYGNPKYGQDLWYDRRRKNQEAGVQNSTWLKLANRIVGWFMHKLSLEASVQSNADVIFCQAPQVRVRLQGHNARLFLLPNGVDAVKYHPTTAIQSDRIKRKTRFLYVGRLAKRKGVEYLIKAFIKLHQKHPETELILIGKGVPEFVEQLKKLALGTNTQFIGEIPFHSVHTYFQHCDVFVMPSLAESFPSSVPKAWACAKPVIASKGGGLDYWFGGELGILVEPANEEELYIAMEKLHLHRDLAIHMGKEARQYVVENLTWDHVGRIMMDALQKSLKEISTHG